MQGSMKQELARNAIILTFGKICTQFVSFLLLPLYTALLIPEEFGIVDLFNTYITLLVPIFNWQFENGLFRFMLDCRNDREGQSKLFSTVLTTNIAQIAIYLAFYLVFERFIHSEYKIFLALDVCGNILLNTMLQFPRGLGKNGVYSIASFISAISTVLLNILFIVGMSMGAYGMFMATLLSKVITIVYLLLMTKAWTYYSFHALNRVIFKEVFKYSIPLVPNNLSWWVVSVSDRTIVSTFISITANGIYTVANKFSTMYITFYNVFNLSWTESVALHLKDADGPGFIREMINTLFKLFSSICIGIIACMPFVFPIMVNQQYSEAYFQIPILMVAVLFQVVVGLYSAIYVSMKKSVEIAKTSFWSALINIAVDIALINSIGLYAASISTLVAYMTMAVYRYHHLKRYVSIEMSGKTILLTIAMTVFTMISYYINHTVLNTFTLFIAVFYAMFINLSFLKSLKGTITQKIQHLR